MMKFVIYFVYLCACFAIGYCIGRMKRRMDIKKKYNNKSVPTYAFLIMYLNKRINNLVYDTVEEKYRNIKEVNERLDELNNRLIVTIEFYDGEIINFTPNRLIIIIKKNKGDNNGKQEK